MTRLFAFFARAFRRFFTPPDPLPCKVCGQPLDDHTPQQRADCDDRLAW